MKHVTSFTLNSVKIAVDSYQSHQILSSCWKCLCVFKKFLNADVNGIGIRVLLNEWKEHKKQTKYYVNVNFTLNFWDIIGTVLEMSRVL